MTSQPHDSSPSQEPNQEPEGIRQWLPKRWYGWTLMLVWLLFIFLPGGWWVGLLLFVWQIMALRYLNAREDTQQGWQETFFRRIFDISAIVAVFVLTIALGSWVVVNFVWG